MRRMMFVMAVFLGAAVVIGSCEKADDVEKPEIDQLFEGAFPVGCDTIYFGETFTFRALFTDNVQLGSYSIEVHENFDQHSHSTEVSECDTWPEREPVNPFQLIEEYGIPGGLTEYEASREIAVPVGNGAGEFDEGDYHFYIRLTDRQGWSVQKGISIKMLKR